MDMDILDNSLQGAILVFCVKCVYGRWRWVAASVAGRGAPPPAPVPRPLARPPRLIAAITETVDTGPRQLPTGWVVPRSQTAEDSSTRDTKRYH